ncbi:hypothetical protein BSZ35_11055 [Salinibacter sp. 10B]|uniref:sulfotransferase family protein n=1 Tax=Salinibacter sp. 10B TaxID=1923971 RepID=UPI000CF41783|nr:sulfotransferase [Salinibacter sp. 10B]PQJ35059.1 hypothetical protein BSZ35_11055 [Salinibacter sp. 10B]
MNWRHLIKNVRHPLKAYLRNPYHLVKNILWRWQPSTSTEKHIFVVGAPRSGTTLLQVLLGNHSACCTWEAETAAFTWQNVFISQRGIFGLEPSRVEKLFEENADLVAFFDAAAHAFRSERGGQILVEKTPQHILQTAFLVEHFPRSTVIHIHRDGRDCYRSARSASIPHGESVDEFARYWAKCIRARLSVNTEQVVDIAYEDLVSAPEKELVLLMQAVGLPFEEEQLSMTRRAEDPRAHHDKFDRLNRSIDASSVGQWKDELNQTEIQEFERIAGKQLKSLGYDLAISR